MSIREIHRDGSFARLVPEDSSRLDQLHSEYVRVKAEADELTARVKELSSAIKSELQQHAPESTTVHLSSPHGTLAMTYRSSRRLDTKKMREELPDIYDHFLADSGSWVLTINE